MSLPDPNQRPDPNQPYRADQIGGGGGQNTPLKTVDLGKITVFNYAIDCNIFGALCYLPICPANLIPAIIALNSSSDSPQFLRYHAVQSLIVTGAFVVVSTVLGMLGGIPFVGWLFGIANMIFILGYILLSLKMVVGAFLGQQTNLPVVSDYARQYSK